MITDDVLHRHAAVGSAEEVRRRLAEYGAAGLDEVVFSATPDGAQIAALLNAARQS
jgi:hypothetical protein